MGDGEGKHPESVVVVRGEDRIDVVGLAQTVLAKAGIAVERRDDDLRLVELGLTFSPRCVSARAVDEGVRTSTVVRTAHATLFPRPTVEYQHAGGEDLEASLASGFEDWVSVDLPVVFDALRAAPAACLSVRFDPDPAKNRLRAPCRVLLGPSSYVVERPAPGDEDSEHPPVCPCCMWMNCFEALEPLLQRDATCGVRLYAARAPGGAAIADCRVDGEDFEPGKLALAAYARTWPDRGLQFRKQYAIVQPLPPERPKARLASVG
ncbi:MAG TPA: DUF6348 family protein [Polyangiaceae bacterium]|jgi:hypothetical protein